MVIVCLSLIFSISFNTYQPSQGWDITREDSTLWVRFCEDLSDSEIRSASLLTLTQRVLDEYNNVESSFVTLDLYPQDISQPPGTKEGFSTFTTDTARYRTITICFNFGNDPTASGQALLDFRDGDWVACEIQLADYHLTLSSSYQATLLHELGHCLGLGHPQDTEQAIMSYNHNGYSKIQLGLDDKMGLTYLYPKNPEDGEESLSFGMGCTLKSP